MQKNRIELAGYLGNKPQVRYLPSGTKVANASLAEGYRWTSNNEEKQHTNWHRLSFYGGLADVAETFNKGDNIFVDGTLQTREFTPSDGHKRTVHEIVVRSTHIISPPRASGPEPPSDNHPAADQASVQVNPELNGDQHEDFWHGPS